MENVCSSLRNAEFSFYRSSSGDEMDLVIQYANKTIAIECKSSTAPQVTKGFWNAIEEIKPDYTYIVAPITGEYSLKENVIVCGLYEILEKLIKEGYSETDARAILSAIEESIERAMEKNNISKEEALKYLYLSAIVKEKAGEREKIREEIPLLKNKRNDLYEIIRK